MVAEVCGNDALYKKEKTEHVRTRKINERVVRFIT